MVMSDLGPDFHRKVDSGLSRAFDRFSETIVYIEVGATSGDVNEVIESEGIVTFQNRRGEDLSVVYDNRFQAQVKVKREEVPDQIVTNTDAENPDQLYVPRIDTYFQYAGETVANQFNTLNVIPLDENTVTIDEDKY